MLIWKTVQSISSGEKIKYLRVNFQDEFFLNKEMTIGSLNQKGNNIITTPIFKSAQKLLSCTVQKLLLVLAALQL